MKFTISRDTKFNKPVILTWHNMYHVVRHKHGFKYFCILDFFQYTHFFLRFWVYNLEICNRTNYINFLLTLLSNFILLIQTFHIIH